MKSHFPATLDVPIKLWGTCHEGGDKLLCKAWIAQNRSASANPDWNSTDQRVVASFGRKRTRAGRSRSPESL